ncbi:MAG: hypothetical protein DHS20C10_13670 [marine bacterium B5-7]|nr:MAG: hypothetical protein DHS20C10_13670 [marine bacterium B5-7]
MLATHLNTSTSVATTNKHWTNDDNQAFYENIPLDQFQKFAKTSGLHKHADLNILLPNILKANTILEVGAGYGRVIEYLLRFKSPQQIHAIEKSGRLHKQLCARYPHLKNIQHDDILTFKTERRYDLILLLWSSLYEFSQAEQFQLLSILKNLLRDTHSKIVIDVPYSTSVSCNATVWGDHFVYINAPFGLIRGYAQKNKEFNRNAKKIIHPVATDCTGLKAEKKEAFTC